MPDRAYLDDQGREMFVSDGISNGRTWGTYRRKPNGSLERFVSKSLPLRPTQDKAQKDLDGRAGRKGWRAAGESETAKGEGNHMSRHVADQELLISEINLDSNIRAVTAVTPEFVASVKKDGVYSRVIVRLADPGTSHVYDMLDGHRRAKGALAAGLETVPARVYDMTVAEYRKTQLLLAEQHEDLDVLDRARAIKGLIDMGQTQQMVADLLGRTQGWVSKQLALLDMPETHELIRRGILSGSAAEEVGRLKGRPELVASLVKSLQEPESPLTVEQVRNAVSDTVYREGKPLDKVAHADCGACDRKVKAYHDDYCLDPACWTAKREAYREKLRASAVAGERPLVPWAAAPAAMETCPEDCPQAGMVLRQQGGDPGRACFAPESECYTARQAEHQARQNEAFAASQKLRAQGDAIRQAEAEAREQAEVERLARVESYLADRIAGEVRRTFRVPESRLLGLLTLSTWAGLEYAARVLGIADDFEDVGPALAALSTRELTTIAMAHVLTSDLNDTEVDAGLDLNAVRDEVVDQTETPEPDERGDLLDAARLVNPPDPDEEDQAEEPATPGPSEDEASPTAIPVDETPESLDTGAEPGSPAPPAGTLLAAFEAEASTGTPAAEPLLPPGHRIHPILGPVFSGEAAIAAEVLSPDGAAPTLQAELTALRAAFGFEEPSPPVAPEEPAPPATAIDCKRDCGRCDQRFCDLHPSRKAQAPPEASATDEPEDEPAPITICPVENVTRSVQHCRTCCRDNKPTDGCCKRVVDGEAPFGCDGVECPAELEEAPTEDAPGPEPTTAKGVA